MADTHAGQLAALTAMLAKRQDDRNMPMPGGDHFGRDTWTVPRWAMILMAVILFILFFLLVGIALLTAFRHRRSGTSSSDIKRSIAAADQARRRSSGISDDDPDGIKPIKRLRSFHMRGAMVMSPEAMSPRTPKTPKSAGLFGRFFRKKDGRRLAPLDEEKNDSYASLNNYPDTPGIDEKMLEASPPPTPAPAFGWTSNVGPGNKRRSLIDSPGGPPPLPAYPGGPGEQNTAYKGDTRPPLGQRESDSFLATSARRMSRDAKRLSTDYNENYQSRPSGGLFDDDDDERRPLGYDPDSRSGH
ncbi:hypothetical protein Dda_5968 [Drechslerella dactyloides]|uniref:Uncharacterized protein n=1 Tax=Drechslerella dactyloides TaxID=74499 RepID=A0AAD6IV98_DREDA|nr:hypothetical protein Dda_5968 [Drechslerella dactyloides]